MRRPALLVLLLLLPACRGSAPQQSAGNGRPDRPHHLRFAARRRGRRLGGGSDRRLTPNLDALLRAGRLVRPRGRAVQPGRLRDGLAVHRPAPLAAPGARGGRSALPGLFTLPEAMQAAGYETAGFTGEPLYSHDSGYGQGFDRLEELGKGTAPPSGWRRSPPPPRRRPAAASSGSTSPSRRLPTCAIPISSTASTAGGSPSPSGCSRTSSRSTPIPRTPCRRARGGSSGRCTATTSPGPTSGSAGCSRPSSRAAPGTARCWW